MLRIIATKPPIYLLCLCVVIVIFSIRSQSPPNGSDHSGGDTVFSMKRAFADLRKIASAPHSLGTAEHDDVMRYIVSACQDAGLSTQVQQTTAVRKFGRTLVAATVHNIIARKKGSSDGKAILLVAHYDSQINTYGAADDGVGVVAMLETARVLKASGQLKNDILFLFTDGEEPGLLGAKAFIDESDLLKQVAMVLNFEARGNSGIATMFETNSNNGWIVKEYINGAKHPNATSLSFEIYKRLPNDTDFTLFKAAGIPGLNNAFIEGFVNYHSMTDSWDRLDLNSLRHEGENMLSLAKHFGNLNIGETSTRDISYFNLFGDVMIHYSAGWDLFVNILVFALFFFYGARGISRGEMTIPAICIGTGAFLMILVILYFLSGFLVSGIRSISPFTDRFYAGNSYNSYYYFFAIAAFSMALFALAYGFILKNNNIASMMAGAIFAEAIVMLVIYFVAPTASYFISIPLLFQLTGNILIARRAANTKRLSWVNDVMRIFFLLPAFLIMSPVIYMTFTAFGLSSQLSAAVVILGLLLGFFLPLVASVIKIKRYFLSILCSICFLAALGLGMYNGQTTKRQPSRTNLEYVLNMDSGKAVWVSSYLNTDSWNSQFFKNARIQAMQDRYGPRLVNDAPMLPLKATTVVFEGDTTMNGARRLTVRFKPFAGVSSFRVILSKNDTSYRIVINGKEYFSGEHPFQQVEYYGSGDQGVAMQFETGPSVKLGMTVVDYRIGVPAVEGYRKMPDNMIFGLSGNTTEVLKSYTF